MDVQKKPTAGELPLGRWLTRELFSHAENRVAAILYAALAFLVAFSFSRTHAVFSAYPFGIALLAAASRRVPFVLAGTILGALSVGERGYAYCAVLVAAFLLRLLLSHPRGEGKYLPACPAYFHEEPALRVALACVCGVFPAVYELLVGGLSLSSFSYAISMVLIPTVASLAYLGFYESGELFLSLLAQPKDKPKSYSGGWALPISLSAFGFTLVLSMRGVSWLGISLPLSLCAVLSLLFVSRFGALRGTAATVVCALGTLTPALLPAYAAMALIGAFFLRAGIFPMLAAACAAGEVIAFLFTGVDSVIAFLPEALVATAIAYPVLSHLPRLFLWVKGDLEKEKIAAQEEVSRRREPSDRLGRLAAAYTDMQGIFSKLAEVAARPSEAEYYAACRRVFEEGCAACSGLRECHELGGKEGKKALLSLASQGAGGVAPAKLEMPDNLLAGCRSRRRLLSLVREAFADLERNRRRCEPHALLAEGCRMNAEVLADAARSEARLWRADPESARRASAAITSLGAGARSVSVFGERKKQLYVTDLRLDEEKVSRAELLRSLEDACACRFGTPVLETTGAGVNLYAESERQFSLSHVRAGAPRGEEVSGDTFSVFEGDGERFYALLSDGMGSGREAAITSGISGAFLRQMLSAGMSCDVALHALNGMLNARGSECSATVDLLEVDLLNGRACFVKSGAAVSYVRRGESLFRIRAGTAPIGILPALDAEKTDFRLQAGDVIIMLSDGISGSPDDAFWLCELLTAGWEENAEVMADKILATARRENEVGDDMTVALLTVSEAA
ncbi:MAG: SpoIIE family protein phosphatase [Clostridia bacterium]|nr:SpoIIE family protein phosphatase [Clostridia bacterium]